MLVNGRRSTPKMPGSSSALSGAGQRPRMVRTRRGGLTTTSYTFSPARGIQVATPKIEILVQRLTTGHYWKSLDKLNEEDLNTWRHLSSVGINEIRDMPCNARSCLAFKASDSSCVGFRYVDGTVGDKAGTQGSDIVSGYYCSGTSEEFAQGQSLPSVHMRNFA